MARFIISGRPVASLDPAQVGAWLADAQSLLQETAARDQRPIRDYACTMLGAVVGLDDSAFFQIGDGAIVISLAGEQDEWCYVFWPQHGEFANTTNFITDEVAHSNLEFAGNRGRIAEVALFSDGLENLVLQKSDRTVFDRWFNQMMPGVRSLPSPGVDPTLSEKLATYLSSEAICNRTDDDKTLVLATRRTK